MTDWATYTSIIAKHLARAAEGTPGAGDLNLTMTAGPLLRLAAEQAFGQHPASERQLRMWQSLRERSRHPEPQAGQAAAGIPGTTDGIGRIDAEIAAIQAELASQESLVDIYNGELDADGRGPRRLYDELLGAAAGLWSELDSSARAIAASATQANEVADPRKLIPALNSVLAKAYPELGEDPVADMIPLRGGGTKLTAMIKLRPNPVFAKNLVLRKDVVGGQTATVAADEHELLVALSNRAVRVPHPVLAEHDPAVLGTPFIIVEEVTDAVTAGHLFPTGLLPGHQAPLSAGFTEEVAESLARLHGITEENEPGLARREYASQASVRDFHRMWQTAPKPPLSIATDLGFSWLVNNPLTADRPRTMVHGDVSLANMLAREGHLAALLDWELAHFGDPAEDLGYARAYFIDPLGAWASFVQSYRAAGGCAAACDPFAVRWYSIWGHVRNTVYISGLRDLVMQGVRDDVVAVDGCTTLYAEVQRLLLDELSATTAEFGTAS